MESTFDLDLERHVVSFDARYLPLYRFDLIVLGSGAAGSAAALAAAQRGCSVAILAKGALTESNTHYAQGGVAAVLSPDDSFESHVQDTLAVGCGLCDPSAVERVVRGGPDVIAQLVELGCEFDRDGAGGLDLSREGGHSEHRIVHAYGAATGLAIQSALESAVREHPEIALFPDTLAIDLFSAPDGRVLGLLARTERDDLAVFGAAQVILATGGAGQLYRETTNPSIATGDGLALAFRAGARLRDLEFVQFHPTCLYIAGAARVLISEIVRGAGGVLLDRTGTRFMPEYHERAELAPRDVVSRAAFDRMVKTRDTSVYLDLSGLERDPHELFPGISRICRCFGIDIARDPIPVRPGAHYMIGGIETDLDGRTTVPSLWAVGECASSGMHGANRMGSNSLLEALVLGRQAGHCAALEVDGEPLAALERRRSYSRGSRGDVQLSIEDMVYSLKSLMWRQMGITRRAGDVQDALEKIAFWSRAVHELAPPNPRALELGSMLLVAQLAAQAALTREESRGVHYRSDFPEQQDEWLAHTCVEPQFEGSRIPNVRILRTPLTESVAAR